MMEIKSLEWDTNFFAYEVALATGFSGIPEQFERIQNFPAKLVYVFATSPLKQLPQNFFFADEKVVFHQHIQAAAAPLVQTEIIELFEPTANLINLALQSGVYSRFKIDPNFKNHEFERLYEKWIINSFDKTKQGRVFAFQEGKNLLGFISIGIKNEIPDIGLIAVDSAARGKGIGSLLLNHVKALLASENHTLLSVTTQGKNLPAMEFYKKNFFEIHNITYIYHVWK